MVWLNGMNSDDYRQILALLLLYVFDCFGLLLLLLLLLLYGSCCLFDDMCCFWVVG